MFRDIYPGRKTQSILDKFQPMVKKSLQEFINDMISKKIESAFEKESIESKAETSTDEVAATTEAIPPKASKIITTEEELESYYITKSILRTHFDSSRVTYKDTEIYFGILVDNNTRKWICRYAFNSAQKYIIFNISKENREKVPIDTLDEIYNYSDKLISIAKNYE